MLISADRAEATIKLVQILYGVHYLYVLRTGCKKAKCAMFFYIFLSFAIKPVVGIPLRVGCVNVN